TSWASPTRRCCTATPPASSVSRPACPTATLACWPGRADVPSSLIKRRMFDRINPCALDSAPDEREGRCVMPVQQTARSTLSRQVIDEFERLISSGEWPLGEKIPAEPELMAALGVSRNTVREAVRALVHTGLLDARPGDGTYVTATDGLEAALDRRFRQ